MTGTARRLGRAIYRLFTLLMFLFLAFLIGLGFFANHVESLRTMPSASADGIVVVTGGAERIGDAIRLLEEGRGRRLFISGVNVQVSAEQLQRRWAGHDAAFQCCIDLDFRARNTIENAEQSALWVQRNAFGSIILVTASYHMPRARLVFETVLPGIRIELHPVFPDAMRLEEWWRDPVTLRVLASEFLKFLAMRLGLAVEARFFSHRSPLQSHA
jgi:uncharacterized SAM-binding protein YcdF (DUF218 family)